MFNQAEIGGRWLHVAHGNTEEVIQFPGPWRPVAQQLARPSQTVGLADQPALFPSVYHLLQIIDQHSTDSQITVA
jgi:hypothetical protein